eukprot:5874713-Pyramimonas_sp.AAC.1
MPFQSLLLASACAMSISQGPPHWRHGRSPTSGPPPRISSPATAEAAMLHQMPRQGGGKRSHRQLL